MFEIHQSPKNKEFYFRLKARNHQVILASERFLIVVLSFCIRHNNGIERDIRPSAVGKKNWLFVGSPEAGERSAVL